MFSSLFLCCAVVLSSVFFDLLGCGLWYGLLFGTGDPGEGVSKHV